MKPLTVSEMKGVDRGWMAWPTINALPTAAEKNNNASKTRP
jgi:hypothetical protein